MLVEVLVVEDMANEKLPIDSLVVKQSGVKEC